MLIASTHNKSDQALLEPPSRLLLSIGRVLELFEDSARNLLPLRPRRDRSHSAKHLLFSLRLCWHSLHFDLANLRDADTLLIPQGLETSVVKTFLKSARLGQCLLTLKGDLRYERVVKVFPVFFSFLCLPWLRLRWLWLSRHHFSLEFLHLNHNG